MKKLKQRVKDFFRLVVLNQVAEVIALLEDDPSLATEIDEVGNTTLHYASSVAMVNALACKGADPSQAGQGGIHSDDAARLRRQAEVANAIGRLWKDAGKG